MLIKKGYDCNINTNYIVKCSAKVRIYEDYIVVRSKFKDTEGSYYNTRGYFTDIEDYILYALNTNLCEFYDNRKEYETFLNNHINASLCELLNDSKASELLIDIDESLFLHTIMKLKSDRIREEFKEMKIFV